MQSSLVAQGLQGATSGGEEERVERSKGHSVCTMSALPPYSTYRTDSKVSSLAVGSCYSRIQNPAFASCEKTLLSVDHLLDSRAAIGVRKKRRAGLWHHGHALRWFSIDSGPFGAIARARVTATSCLPGWSKKGGSTHQPTRGSCTTSVLNLHFTVTYCDNLCDLSARDPFLPGLCISLVSGMRYYWASLNLEYVSYLCSSTSLTPLTLLSLNLFFYYY